MPRTPGHAPPEVDNNTFRIQAIEASSAIVDKVQDRFEDWLSEKTASSGRLGRLRSIGKAIWYGGPLRDWHKQRRQKKDIEKAVEEGMYALSGGNKDQHDQAIAAGVRRFSSGDADMLDTVAGETNVELAADNPLFMDLKELVLRYTSDRTITPDQFDQAEKEIVARHAKTMRKADRLRGLAMATDAKRVAENGRHALDHHMSLADLEAQITGRLGEARLGVRAEHRKELADKAFDYLYKHHLSGVNETSVGIGAVAAVTATKFSFKKALAAAGAFAGIGLGVGLIAGTRQFYRSGQEITHFRRKLAEGAKVPADTKSRRLKAFEDVKYDSKSAQELIGSLDMALREIKAGDGNRLSFALSRITEVQARKDLSVGRDLIHFSSETTVEQEREVLYDRLRQAKLAFQAALDSTSRGVLGSKSVEELITNNIAGVVGTLQADIDKKEKAARRIRIKSALAIGAIACVVGGTIGMAIQESVALADDGRRSVLEGGGGQRHTLLASLRDNSYTEYDQDGSPHEEFFYGGNNGILGDPRSFGVNLPNGAHLVQVGPDGSVGRFDLVGPDGTVWYHGVEWDEQGNLAKGVRQALVEQHGLHLTQGELYYDDTKPPGVGENHRHFETNIQIPVEVNTSTEVPGVLPIWGRRGIGPFEAGATWAGLPAAELETRRRAEIYWRTFGNAYQRRIEALATDLVAETKIARAPKAVVIITADARHDRKDIKAALEQYKNQTGINMERDIEIVVFAAQPQPGAGLNHVKATIEEIRRFQRLNPNLKIRVVERHELKPTEAKRPWVRRAITDAVIADLLRRGVNLTKVSLLYNGANSAHIDPNYLKTVIDKMLQHDEVDMLVGRARLNFDPDKPPREMVAATRISRLIERLLPPTPGRLGSAGANIALRPEAYISFGRKPFTKTRILADPALAAMITT